MNPVAIDSSLAATPARRGNPSPTVNEGKCPHGSPVGACVLCIGGGGGGSGSAKRSGLMTWNEAYAVWMAIQRAKTNAEDDAKQRELNRLGLARELHLQTIRLEAILAWGTSLMTLVWRTTPAWVQQTAVQWGRQMGNLVTSFQQIGRILYRPVAQVFEIADKLVTIFGEQKKLLQDFLEQATETLKAYLLKFAFIEQLVVIKRFQDKAFQEFLASRREKLRKWLHSFLDIFENLTENTNWLGLVLKGPMAFASRVARRESD